MGTALYNILIMPIILFIEIVFNVMNLAFKSPGIAIIFVSITVQLLCFPLYKRADAIQEQERLKQKEMKPWLDHIKKTFKGDERFMMQQAYYKLSDYKPFYAIKGSVSLLLQIPFFIAAYNFLSGLDALKYASFMGIADLSKPDQLITIGAISINLLPILMTLFNLVSGVIYTKGFPIKDKIQTYGLAIIFLVLLYKSPSGLVFYWTLNNVFSLVKNVFTKYVKNPKKVITIALCAAGIFGFVYVLIFSKRSTIFNILALLLSLVCVVPAVFSIIKSKVKTKATTDKNISMKLVNSLFYTSILAVFLLVAIVIPVNVIKTSPVDFISTSYGPFGLIFRIACIFFGLLFVWINIFYLFSSDKIKKYFSIIAGVIAVVFPVNYFFFGRNLGIISSFLIYLHHPDFSVKQILCNALIVAVAALIALLVSVKKSEWLKRAYQIAAITFAVTAIVGIVSIERTLSFEGHPEKNRAEVTMKSDTDKIIPMSKNGKNVVVLMLDRAMSGYIPYMLEEKPELTKMFDGFTYYPNTISFGGSTVLGSPSLFGGYDYTPLEINKRKTESLTQKQNEALTVLPKLFSDKQYSVTVCDPPFAGYKNIPDLSIYDDYKGISAYNLIGAYSAEDKSQYSSLCEPQQVRSFVFYNIMKSLPLAVQNLLYQNGLYWSTGVFAPTISSFLDSYSVLKRLPALTEISSGNDDNFLMMKSRATHEPIILDESNYEPSLNARLPENNIKKAADGSELDLSNTDHMRHYHCNISSMLRLGEWFDYLREQGVYDNTRIILVADHGFNLGQFDYMKLSNGVNVEMVNPLLLVKDFNSKGFKTSDEFMTNADTPAIALKDIINNPVNPFTGNPINSDEKTSHSQTITTSEFSDNKDGQTSTLYTDDGEWWMVNDNIFDVNNWKKAEVK